MASASSTARRTHIYTRTAYLYADAGQVGTSIEPGSSWLCREARAYAEAAGCVLTHAERSVEYVEPLTSDQRCASSEFVSASCAIRCTARPGQAVPGGVRPWCALDREFDQ